MLWRKVWPSERILIWHGFVCPGLKKYPCFLLQSWVTADRWQCYRPACESRGQNICLGRKSMQPFCNTWQTLVGYLFITVYRTAFLFFFKAAESIFHALICKPTQKFRARGIWIPFLWIPQSWVIVLCGIFWPTHCKRTDKLYVRFSSIIGAIFRAMTRCHLLSPVYGILLFRL